SPGVPGEGGRARRRPYAFWSTDTASFTVARADERAIPLRSAGRVRGLCEWVGIRRWDTAYGRLRGRRLRARRVGRRELGGGSDSTRRAGGRRLRGRGRGARCRRGRG